MAQALSADVRIEDPEFYFDPWDVYARLRRDAPVFWYAPLRMWVLTKYEDIRAVTLKPEVFTSTQGAVLNDAIMAQAAPAVNAADGQSDNVIDHFFDEEALISTSDGPAHVAMRKAIAAAFSPQRVAMREKVIRGFIRSLLAELPVGTPFDFYETIASRLPFWAVILHVGFSDLSPDDLRQWTDTIDVLGRQVDAVEMDRAAQAIRSVVEYVGAQIDREAALGAPGDNVLSVLLRQREIISQLTARNLVSVVLLAGAGTTRAMLATIMYALATHRDQLAAAVREPSIAPAVVEEALRWSPPVISFIRTAVADTEIRGQRIRAGERVLLLFHAANHDDEVFPEPERFDITRRSSVEHIAFGYGMHRCPGAQFARLELTAFLEEFLACFDAIELVSEPQRLNSFLTNSFTDLHIAVRERKGE
jgi:cytochrome P450